MAINLDTKIVRNTSLLSSEIDGETVMMSVEQGNYYGINKVGTEIWKLIETPMTVREVCETLVKEYKVDRGVCENEVILFLNELTDEHIIATG